MGKMSEIAMEIEENEKFCLPNDCIMNMMQSYESFNMLINLLMSIHISKEHSEKIKRELFDDVLSMVMKKYFKDGV